MAGFRAAGWTCFAVSVFSFGIALFGLRGIGIVGQRAEKPGADETVQLSDLEQRVPTSDKPSAAPTQSTTKTAPVPLHTKSSAAPSQVALNESVVERQEMTE